MNRRWSLDQALIVTKTGDAAASELGLEMAQWLQRRRKQTRIIENPRESDPNGEKLREAVSWIEPFRGLVIILGGDGTLISVARKILDLHVPLLGVNLGQVGFLTQLTRNDWPDNLEELKIWPFACMPYIALDYAVVRDKQTIHSGVLVNDMVVTRGVKARMVNLGLRVDREKVGNIRADGLIVATPMGATGYSASARGPLIHPYVGCYCITPICPFLFDFHPLIVCKESVVEIKVLDATSEVYATIDGQEFLPLQVGDRVKTSLSKRFVLMAMAGKTTYFHQLRRKGFIRDDETLLEELKHKYSLEKYEDPILLWEKVKAKMQAEEAHAAEEDEADDADENDDADEFDADGEAPKGE